MQKLGARLKDRLNRSAFFFGAVLFHLVLFLALIGYVVWQPQPPEKEAQFGRVEVQPPPAPPFPPTNPITPPSPPSSMAGLDPITSTIPAPGNAGRPILDSIKGTDINTALDGARDQIKLPPNSPSKSPSSSPVDLHAVHQTVIGWMKPGTTNKFVVPIYLAKYADGDWNCNDYLHDGKLASGALPNLMAKIAEWSHGEITGRDLKVVSLDSRQILDDPPPFIFFTGHKNFQLTKAEVSNLAKYLEMGGAIWGDSAFAGSGSRFDVAFHREMKRVLPDADVQWQLLPADHPIFTQGRFHLGDLPRGMNQRGDPIECLNLGDKLAVLYTPNDYSDLLTMLLQPGVDERNAQMDHWDHWTTDHPLFTPASFTIHAPTYFRNYDAPAAMGAYKLSMNVLVYLIHRYDEELQLDH